MNFALTEDQIMIRDAAESFLADVSASAAVRAAAASESGHDAGVWQRIASELGWCGIPIAEAQGGLGLGAVELTLVLEQMGRHLLCAPFFSTVCLAANLLNEVASETARQRFLPGIADGSLRITAPLPSRADDWSQAADGVQAQRAGEAWRLDGQIARVPDAAGTDWLLIFARTDHAAQPGLFAIPRDAAGLRLTPLQTWDTTRRFYRVDLDGVRIAASQRIDDERRCAEGYARSAALARLYLAAEQLGGAQVCLDLTVAYTATRKQFGRAVAGFQAIKHRCAEMMVRLEGLRSAVRGAALLAAGEHELKELLLDCAMTRALAADTFFYCAQEAIQLHGGVGFTWEYDPQLYFKRAQAGSHWMGGADELRERIAQVVIDRGQPLLPLAGEGWDAGETTAPRLPPPPQPSPAIAGEGGSWVGEQRAGFRA